MYKNGIKYYLIYIGMHLHVILKKNNNSSDKYYICYGFLNSLYGRLIFLRNFVKCPHCIQMLVWFYYFLADDVFTFPVGTDHCPL